MSFLGRHAQTDKSKPANTKIGLNTGPKTKEHASMNYQQMLKDRKIAADAYSAIVEKAAHEKRSLTAEEDQLCDAHERLVNDLTPKIKEVEDKNTLIKLVKELGPVAALYSNPDGPGPDSTGAQTIFSPEQGRAKAAQARAEFGQFYSNVLKAVGGMAPKMEATAPSGPISVGSGGGLDSIGVTVVPDVLPFLPTYFNLDSFGLAGAFQIYTEHTRPLIKPVISAGAADGTFAENAAPTTSQPFGLASFTFGGTKYSRLVLASYEALMNSELPLNGVIMDELLATIATTLTKSFTTQMYTAFEAAPSLLVTGSDLYQTAINLRHAIPPRFDLPDNRWMLSRATLAKVKNTRASTSGVPMFDPNSNLIFGREYVVNDNFDDAASGLAVYGSWKDGAYLRKTPLFTRVFMELFANNGQVGFRTTQWADAHFLAELAADGSGSSIVCSQPPANQPLYHAILS